MLGQQSCQEMQRLFRKSNEHSCSSGDSWRLERVKSDLQAVPVATREEADGFEVTDRPEALDETGTDPS